MTEVASELSVMASDLLAVTSLLSIVRLGIAISSLIKPVVDIL